MTPAPNRTRFPLLGREDCGGLMRSIPPKARCHLGDDLLDHGYEDQEEGEHRHDAE